MLVTSINKFMSGEAQKMQWKVNQIFMPYSDIWFGRVSDHANNLLKKMDSSLSIKPNSSIDSTINGAKADTFISRTNAGLLRKLVYLINIEKSPIY